MRTPRITLGLAIQADAAALAALHAAVATDLTAKHGAGAWSSAPSVRGVLAGMRHSKVCIARDRGKVIGTFRLCTKKPWAIDVRYFTPCKRPIYLLNMAVEPGRQRRGVGRACMEEARRMVENWPGDAIRLDAFDASAGAERFYRKCGFREVGRTSYRQTPLVYFELKL